MSISTETSKVRYEGNGSTYLFPFTFKLNDPSHLEVIVTDDNGVETTLTYGVDFDIESGGSSGDGVQYPIESGDIKYPKTGTSYLPDNYYITGIRSVPVKQLTDFNNQGGFFAQTHEDAFDYLTMVCLQLQEEIDRTYKVSAGSGESGDALMEIIENSTQTCINSASDAEAAQVAAEEAQVAAEEAASVFNQNFIYGNDSAKAASPAAGDWYFATDTNKLYKCVSAGTWVEFLNGTEAGLTFVIDGGGDAITTGIKGFIEMPFAGTIASVTLLADQSGSVTIDIWKDTYANFPPTDADSITASAVPAISSATKSQDSTLTGWTKTFSKGDIIAFNVDSCATITRVTVALKVTRTA